MKRAACVFLFGAVCFSLIAPLWGEQSNFNAPANDITALVGGTVIDVSDFGGSTNDVADAVVLIEGGRIAKVGSAASIEVPSGAVVVDVRGKFLIPGLIDGFATQNNQKYADAHLAMGVTGIIALPSDDSRRGQLWRGEREPRVFPLQQVYGYDISRLDRDPGFDEVAEIREKARRLSPAEVAQNVDVLSWYGCKVLLLMYPMEIDQVRAVVARAHALRLATIGELGHTSYMEAAKAGVQSFVHTTRIEAEVAPPDVRRFEADHPFKPQPEYIRFLSELDPSSPPFRQYAMGLASEGVGLMPTLSLMYLRLPGHRNPWKEVVGPLIDPRDVHSPADRETGEPPPVVPPNTVERVVARNQHLMKVQASFAKAGDHFLAGSGTDAFGVLPGTGLHTEMELLVQIGLTPRQALAAATWNYSRLFGWRELGQVGAGCVADIVVLDSNPVADIMNTRSIIKVFFRGQELDRKLLLKP